MENDEEHEGLRTHTSNRFVLSFEFKVLMV